MARRAPKVFPWHSAPVQFERTGYFCTDTRDSAPGRLVFKRTVGLRDTWGKIEKAAG
jgi:hypothetical protein